MVYGVRDDGNGKPVEINGITDAEKLRIKIIKSAASIANLNPPIFVNPIILQGEVKGEQKTILVVNVEESPIAPHFHRGTTTFWVRGADHNNPIEATSEMMHLLQNRRSKMEDKRKEQLDSAKQLSLNWLIAPQKVKPTAYITIPSPYFVISLQPKIFNETLLDIRKLKDAINETCQAMAKKHNWPSAYHYRFFGNNFESYPATFVYRENYDGWNNNKCLPMNNCTSASSTGLLYHFEDMPYKGPPIEDKVNNECLFDSYYVLRRVTAFLLFAKEFYSIVNIDVALDLTVEFCGTESMRLNYYDKILEQRIIKGDFSINRSVTTMDLNVENIEKLVIGSIAPELFIDINFMSGFTMALQDVSSIKKVFSGS